MQVKLIYNNSTMGLFMLPEVPQKFDTIQIPEGSMHRAISGFPECFQGLTVDVEQKGHENIGGEQVPVFVITSC